MAAVRFSLIHPSRGRVEQAGRTIDEWRAASSGRHECEHLLSVDTDDADLDRYAALARDRGVHLLTRDNRSVVDAVNHGAGGSTGDILIVIADDFGCPPGWDDAVAAVIGERRDVAVLVHDGIDGRIMTLPIVDRAFFQSYGYVYFPDYISMYCDDDLTECASHTGRLIDARHLRFPHRHPAATGAALDATYQRQARPLAWIEGRRVLARRRATAFGAAPRSLSLALTLGRIEIIAAWQRAGSRVKRRVLRLPPP
jgi:hypothetical protein